MSEELTLKQSKWLKLYLELGNATEAAFQVYECQDRNSAKQIGHENLTKLDYEDFLEEAGITDNLLQQKIIEGLESTKPIAALVLVSGDKPMKTKDNEGQIEVPDYAIRHKYLETALKLKKRLKERMDVTTNDKELNVTIMDYANQPKRIPSTETKDSLTGS